MDAIDSNNGTTETCSDEEHTLPILQKITELNNKVQEHTILCEDVKAITTNSFPGSEVYVALQDLKKCENLKKKYFEESLERKWLYNEVIDLKGNIRVFFRYRPLNQYEIIKGSTSIVNFDASNENELQLICSYSTKKQFKFDHVFGPEENQEAVFLQTLPIVISVLDGYNVCKFAYEQTGTGKTFTMEGNPDNLAQYIFPKGQ